MAYETLKSIITQNINTNGQESITGAVLQQILLRMVDELGYTPEGDLATKEWVNTQLSDYASQKWVISQGYATITQLADYLPLTGGRLTGNLELFNSGLQVVLSSKGKLLYTTSLSGFDINIYEYQSDGTSIKSKSTLNNDELYFTNQGVKGTSITYSSVTSDSFIKNGGTSNQVLCADGSVKTLAELKAALNAI